MITDKPTGDPRLEALFGTPGEPRELGPKPVVRLPRSGPPTAVFVGAALLATVLLFWVLESRRRAALQPPVAERTSDLALAPRELPPLYVPPPPPPVAKPVPEVRPALPAPLSATPPSVVQPQLRPQPVAAPVTAPAPPPTYASEVPPARRVASGPIVVVDGTQAGSGAGPTPSSPAPGAGASPTGPVRVRSSTLANRSLTVAQGTLVPAVLETAFDSTRPGFARALVSRDVRGFDGTQVLIPRGSRLIGEYRSDTALGQKRALIIWNRLIRPDGVTIQLDSPAVDTLGRGGVAARVNSHFFERLTSALLSSSIDLGRTAVSAAVSGGVVLAVPGSTSSGGPAMGSQQIVPTLRVPAGKSIRVFIAQDLEFAAAGKSQ